MLNAKLIWVDFVGFRWISSELERDIFLRKKKGDARWPGWKIPS